MSPSSQQQPEPGEKRELIMPDEVVGQRLDQALASLLPEYSRSRIQQLIVAGQITQGGAVLRSRDRVAANMMLTLELPPPSSDPSPRAQAMDLHVVFEDEDMLVINKPAGLVVHPGAGNPDGTLLNALLHHAPELESIPRAGLIHRLDKDTSGLLVVARSELAHLELTQAMQARQIERQYQAVVCGVMTAGGSVDAPLGRHSRDRKRMSVARGGAGGKSRAAVTHYRVIQRYRAHSHIRLKLETGRTHQIRVHMQHIHHPLVGDPVYGGRPTIPPAAAPELLETLRNFKRQALHAWRLGLVHPRSHEVLAWVAPLPDDMQQLLLQLQADAAGSAE